jgi:hypothetical protein
LVLAWLPWPVPSAGDDAPKDIRPGAAEIV